MTSTEQPKIYKYLDYREYLREAYQYKKQINPAYSESAFIQAAGMGKNSRGYLGLILKGKRNLALKTILGLASALKLDPKETMYFENLVHFNQAESEKEKIFFFERMKVSAQNEKNPAYEILEIQYRYLSQWHLVALREVVQLADFDESPQWIIKKMRGQVTKDQVIQGLDDLLQLGLIKRDNSGHLVQTDAVVTFNESHINFKNVIQLHQQFNDRAKELMAKDPYEKRAARLTTLSCRKEDFAAIREEMKQFSNSLLARFADDKQRASNVVLQMGMQLFHITE